MTRHRTADDITACAARMIRAAGVRVGQEDPEQLKRLYDLQAELTAAIARAIDGQRSSGITWQSIGEALGVTKQAALMRWGGNQQPESEGTIV